MEINNRPNPNEAFPNPKIPSLCFIKNVVKNPRIIIGDYTYYDDVDGADQFEKHVTHFYDFIGDRLIIGKFCAIAKGVEFVMNGANHRMDGVTTYPFYVIGGDWGSAIAPPIATMTRTRISSRSVTPRRYRIMSFNSIFSKYEQNLLR